MSKAFLIGGILGNWNSTILTLIILYVFINKWGILCIKSTVFLTLVYFGDSLKLLDTTGLVFMRRLAATML